MKRGARSSPTPTASPSARRRRKPSGSSSSTPSSETETPALPLGHNNPPEDTPFDHAREAISLLDAEARNWFDGAPIENERQAADVARILDAARKAKQQADNARKAEKEPHAQAAKAVDEKWRPILADADRIAECAKAAQTKWLIKLDAEKRAIAEAARK
jgi:hypothetical protein